MFLFKGYEIHKTDKNEQILIIFTDVSIHVHRFMGVPFLFEMRALMDWIWTDTSMTLSDWLKLEDIFANIFQLKVHF